MAYQQNENETTTANAIRLRRISANVVSKGYTWHRLGFWYRVADVLELGLPVGRMGTHARPCVAFAEYDYAGELASLPVGMGYTPSEALADLIIQLRAAGALRPTERISTVPPPAPRAEDPDEYLQWGGDWQRCQQDEEAWQVVDDVTQSIRPAAVLGKDG